MASELVLYTNPMSRGRIARWMLEETGAEYTARVLEYGSGMKSPEYLAINPMGKVPAIVHGETVVTECAAICAYLADVFPDPGLAPPQDERGAYYRWLFFAAGPLETAVTNHFLGVRPDDRQRMTTGYGSLEAVLDAIEGALGQREYIAGSDFTAADVYLGAQIGWGLQFGTIDKRDAFVAYWDRLKDRPAHLRASELDDAAMKQGEGNDR